MRHLALTPTIGPSSRFTRRRCLGRAPVFAPKCCGVKRTASTPFVRTHLQTPLTSKVAEAPSHVPRSSSTEAGPSDQSEVSQVVLRGYQLIASLSLLRCLLMMVIAPITVALVARVSMSPAAELVARVLGILWIAPLGFLFLIQSAVADGQVDSNLTKRFAGGLLLSETATAAIMIAMRRTLDLTQAGLARTVIFPVSLLALYYAAYSKISVSSVVDGVVDGVKATFKKQDWKAGFYSVLSVILITGACAQLVNPAWFLEGSLTGELGEIGAAAVRLWSPIFFLLGIGAYTLREAAENGELGSKTARTLNLTILIMTTAFLGLSGFMHRSVFTTKGLVELVIDGALALPIVYFLFAEKT